MYPVLEGQRGANGSVIPAGIVARSSRAYRRTLERSSDNEWTSYPQAMGAQISGATGGTHTLSYSPNAGTPYPWEGNSGGTNTGNGNKLTTVPIVSWTQRGGLPVSFYLSHNSQSTHNSELGQKWTFSYDIYLMSTGSGGGIGNLAVHWGDDLSYIFTNSGTNTFSSPTGIHDTLVYNVDSTFTLTKPDQTQYHFNTGGYCDTITDENSNSLTIAHNTGNYVTVITDCTGRAISLGYDSSNRINSITDPLSRVWSIAYSTSGNNLTSITFPALGSTYYSESFTYDSLHDISQITSPGSRTTSFTYNSDSSLATSTDGCSNTTSYSYAGTSTTITDPNSHVLIDYYNSSGLLSQVQDNSGGTITPSYDSAHNVTSWVDQRGYTWHATFDGAGNCLTSVDPYSDTVIRTYNSNNKLLTASQPTGESFSLTRDSHDNVTCLAFKNSSGTTEATEAMTYSSSGVLLTKTDSNSNETQYGHGPNGDLTSVTTPSGKETQFGVDGIGMRTSRTDAESRETTYSLDSWERCTTTTYPDSTTHGFAYDADSNVTSFSDSTGTTYRYYDGDSRTTSESKGGSTVVAYGYDASGKKGLLSTVTDSNSRVMTRSYDGLNRLSSLSETAGTTYYSYDACSNETGVTLPSGATVARDFDHGGSLTSITNSSVISGVTATLSSYSYVLDADSRRSSCTEYSGDVVSWGYDWGNRLTSESRTGSSAYSTSYTVDGEGRRTSEGVTVSGATATTSFSLNSDDELTSTSSSTGGFVNSYSYSDNGEQIGRTLSGTSYSLNYDYDGQCTSITGSSTTSFSYDAIGRRVSRTAGGTTTSFQYAGDAVLLEKQGSTTTATYTYGNALIRKDGETPLYDGLGTARAETNSSQAVTSTLTSEAFGNVVTTTGSTGSSYGFAATCGYRSDGDAGVTKVGARYYDPQVGSFITRDTYLGQRPYLYCDHDPVNAVDPSGHLTLTFSLGLMGELLFFGGWGDIGLSVDGNGGWGVTGHLGGGMGVGVGASSGLGLGLGSGNISPGSSGDLVGAGFIGDGFAGGSGSINYGTGGGGISGGAGRMGPTAGFGIMGGGQAGYTWRGPGNWLRGLGWLVRCVSSMF